VIIIHVSEKKLWMSGSWVSLSTDTIHQFTSYRFPTIPWTPKLQSNSQEW
jgi:hypothetical protein